MSFAIEKALIRYTQVWQVESRAHGIASQIGTQWNIFGLTMFQIWLMLWLENNVFVDPQTLIAIC